MVCLQQCNLLNIGSKRQKSFGSFGEEEEKVLRRSMWSAAAMRRYCCAPLAARERSRSSSSPSLWCLGTRLFKWLTKGAFCQTKKSREDQSTQEKSQENTKDRLNSAVNFFFQKQVDPYFIKVCEVFRLIKVGPLPVFMIESIREWISRRHSDEALF